MLDEDAPRSGIAAEKPSVPVGAAVKLSCLNWHTLLLSSPKHATVDLWRADPAYRPKDDVSACRPGEQGQQRDGAYRALDPIYAHAEVSHGVSPKPQHNRPGSHVRDPTP